MATNTKINTLYIDCQILQTAAFDRGMGKYVTSLLKSIRIHHNFVVKIILNNNLDTSAKRISAIRHQTEQTDMVMLDLPTDIANDWKRKNTVAENIITDFIEQNNSKGDSAYVIAAPFFVGFSSVFPRQDNIKKFVIVYDITPQKIEHIQKIFPDDLYYQHYRLFFEADHILTISESVKEDLQNYVGVSIYKMTSIDGAPFELRLDDKYVPARTYKTPFIHFPSGSMIHKNNERAVRAFKDFNQKHDDKYTLYITSSFDEEYQKKLQEMSPNVIFTGNVSDEEMHYAFKHASVVLFASLAEGLGMPVLEATKYSTPVACSDIPVLNELSKDAFFLFDPIDISSITHALSEAVSIDKVKQKHKAIERVKQKYTWERSAGRLVSAVRRYNRTPQHNHKVIINNQSSSIESLWLEMMLYGNLASSGTFTSLGDSKSVNSPVHYYAVRTEQGKGEMISIKSSSAIGQIIFRRPKLDILVNNETAIKLKIYNTVLDRTLNYSVFGFKNTYGDNISIVDIIKAINVRG